MNRRTLQNGAVLVAAVLTLMVLGPASTLASTPGWVMTVVPTPKTTPCFGFDFCGTVSPGSYVSFKVTITNSGKSNIAKLFLTDTAPGTPTSVTPSDGCNTSGQLVCSLGALGPGKSVFRTVVYQMPSLAGNFDFAFEANTSGVSGSDGGTSHGDTLRRSGRIVLDGSGDFVGGYLLTGGDLSTTGGGGGQDTTLTPPETGIGVTLREVTGTDNPCSTIAPLAHGVGQLVLLNVSDGKVYTTPFKTVLTISTSGLPDELHLNQVKLCHQYDHKPAAYLIKCATDAAPTPPGPACFWPKWVGQDWHDFDHDDADDWSFLVIDMFDYENGGFRAQY